MTTISQQFCPALILYPLNDSFSAKYVSLPDNHRCGIGRQTDVTSASRENGYFDASVLSKQHAEIWEESGKASISLTDIMTSH